MKSSPRSRQLEKAHAQQRRPNAAKKERKKGGREGGEIKEGGWGKKGGREGREEGRKEGDHLKKEEEINEIETKKRIEKIKETKS